jgi:hypothetical protein
MDLEELWRLSAAADHLAGAALARAEARYVRRRSAAALEAKRAAEAVAVATDAVKRGAMALALAAREAGSAGGR